MASKNSFELTAWIIERSAIRYTPAGVPVITLTLQHQSKQMEAGSVRDVEVAIDAVGIGDIANNILNVPSDKLCLFEGFIAAKSLKNQRPQFHITGFTLIE